MMSNPSTTAASQPTPATTTPPPTANATTTTGNTNAATTTTTSTAKSKAPSTKTNTKNKTVTKASGAAGTQAKVKKPASRKKPAATNTNNRNTTTPTAETKAQAEARKLDPLWYRIEDVLLWDTSTPSSSSILPEQVPFVQQVLSHYGLTTADVTPQALTCLLEQSRRFAQEVMGNAHDLAFAANRTEIQEGDLKLAVQLRPDFRIATTAQIPKLHQLAQHINRMPLPPIPSHCYAGVVLPPAPYQLTARTYDIVSGAKVQRKMSVQVPLAPPKQKSTISYGATKGRQIPIQLKSTVEEASPSKMDVTSTAEGTATTNISTATPVDGNVASKEVHNAPMEEKNEDAPQDPVPMDTSTTPDESTTTPAEVITTDPTPKATPLPQQQPEEAITPNSEEVQHSDVVMKEEQNEMETQIETTAASEPSNEKETQPFSTTNK